MLMVTEQDLAHVLLLLVCRVSADLTPLSFLLLADFLVLLFYMSAKGHEVRSLDAAGFV